MKNTVNKTISLTQETIEMLEKQAKKNGMSGSAYIRFLLIEKSKHHE